MTDNERVELEAEVAALRSELDQCKSQLIDASQMTAVGELLAGIVHEINTPIGSILSNNEVGSRSLQMLNDLLEQAQREGASPPPKVTKILKTLLSLTAVDKIACERIISVIRGLKTFVGGGGAEYRKADVNAILDNTLKLANCEFRRRIQVETDYGSLPEVECESHQLGQVFLNILVNAGHAIEGEGKIRIKTESEGDRVHIAITDDGGGIAPENREKVFSTGFTTKPAGIGTGRGLAISKDIIVNRHGGTIDFESEVGRGTTFHIRIPVSHPDTGRD